MVPSELLLRILKCLFYSLSDSSRRLIIFEVNSSSERWFFRLPFLAFDLFCDLETWFAGSFWSLSFPFLSFSLCAHFSPFCMCLQATPGLPIKNWCLEFLCYENIVPFTGVWSFYTMRILWLSKNQSQGRDYLI